MNYNKQAHKYIETVHWTAFLIWSLFVENMVENRLSLYDLFIYLFIYLFIHLFIYLLYLCISV